MQLRDTHTMQKITFTYIHLYHAGVREIQHELDQIVMFLFDEMTFVSARQTDNECTEFLFTNGRDDVYVFVHDVRGENY